MEWTSTVIAFDSGLTEHQSKDGLEKQGNDLTCLCQAWGTADLPAGALQQSVGSVSLYPDKKIKLKARIVQKMLALPPRGYRELLREICKLQKGQKTQMEVQMTWKIGPEEEKPVKEMEERGGQPKSKKENQM